MKILSSHLLSLIFDFTIDSFENVSELNTHIKLIFYFTHSMNSLFKLHYRQFSNSIESFFPNFFYFANFSNILNYFQYTNIFLLFYYIVLALVIYPLFFIVLASFLRFFFKIVISKKNICYRICAFIFQNFNWIMITPILELLINPFDCDWFLFTKDCSFHDSVFLKICSFFGIVWVFAFGMLIIYFSKNYRFFSRKLEFENSLIRITIFMLRNLQIVLFMFFKHSTIIVYLFSHAIGILSFVEYFFFDGIKNHRVSQIYLYYLCAFESILMSMTLWNYIDLINNETLFFISLFFCLLSIKIGVKIGYNRYQKFILNSKEDILFVEKQEEIKMYGHNSSKIEFAFKCLGYLLTDFKKDHSNLNFKETWQDFNKDSYKFILKEATINSYIMNKFTSYLSKKDIKHSEEKRTEDILKYIDFLKQSHFNPKKILFELEKMKEKIPNKHSFFVFYYLKKIRSSIKNLIFETNQLLPYKLKEQNLQVSNYFRMCKIRFLFIEKIGDILKQKMQFWRDYIIGFKRMDNFVHSIQSLGAKIERFFQFIQKYSIDANCKVIALKAFSIHNCIFLNELQEAIKFEDEFQKLFNNELCLRQSNMQKLTFIDKDIVICEASFITMQGKIKESSKTQKLGDLFGYSYGEIQLIKFVEDLMPDYLKNIHSEFIKNYINKPKMTLNTYPNHTFALHKKNYIIPICSYISLQSASNDFMLIAAIQYDQMNDNAFIVHGNTGSIMGVSKKMMEILNEKINNFDIDKFQTVNLFDCILELKDIVDNNNIAGHNFVNHQHGIFDFKTKKNRKSQKFEIDFDLKIHKYSFSNDKKLIVYNMLIKNFSEFIDNTNKGKILNELIEFDTENIEDSSRKSNPKDRWPNHYIEPKGFFERMKLQNPKMIENIENKPKIELNEQKNERILNNFPSIESDSQNKIKFERMESENSSVLKNKSKTFKVFAGIKKIKKFVPHNFYFFFLGIFLEFILIIIYTILLGSSVNNYFQNSFYPIQSGIINFCQQYSSLALSTGVTIEYEYQILNMTVISNDTNYNNFYNRIIERSFTRAKTIIYNARNSPQNLEYQNVYQNEPTLIVEIFARPKFLRVVSYFDYIDGNLKFLLDDLKTDFKTWEFDILIFLQRNYPFFLNPSARIFAEVQSSFLYYIMELSNKMSSFLIIFVVIMIVIKVFEIYNIGYLYLLVQKLVLIFLRCNQKEALREYQFLQDILESNEKKDDFLFLDFTEKVKMKENENAIEKNKRIHKISLEKNKKKVINSYSNISPLKKTKGIVFIVLTTCLSLFYYFLNNIYWNEFNSKINNIINLDISFASMYVYSVSVLILNNLYIREMLITSPSYEYLQNIYQQPSGRRTYFYGALNKRITTITNIFNKELQLNVIPAAGKINDPNFELLLNENLCDVLKDLGKIEEDENVVCNRIWGGVFKNGIIMGVNQYLQELQEISPLRVQIADKNSSSYQNLIKNITKYIEDPLHQDFYLGEYFLSEALFLLYGFINEYFNPLLEQEKISTQTTLFLTMSFLIFIFCSLAVMIFKYMRNYYKYLALSISIMPFEKITEDEATMQIIENFTKNFS